MDVVLIKGNEWGDETTIMYRLVEMLNTALLSDWRVCRRRQNHAARNAG
jgi:hypothetical protein